MVNQLGVLVVRVHSKHRGVVLVCRRLRLRELARKELASRHVALTRLRLLPKVLIVLIRTVRV